MGMTDRQFDAYQETLLMNLKEALKISPDNEKLKEVVTVLERQLKRP